MAKVSRLRGSRSKSLQGVGRVMHVERTLSWFGRKRRLVKDREPCRNPRHLRYPRLHPARPQTACQNDEDVSSPVIPALASEGKVRPKAGARLPHSMTSLARARIDGGTVRPSALAVLRLMTSSNLVGS
jgi:hypothetical protein